MILKNNENEQELFLQFIKDFLQLLSVGKVEDAYHRLDDHTNYTKAWSKENLQLFLQLNIEDEPHLSIDNPYEVSLPSNHRYDVYEYNDNSGYGVEYDLTSDGEINDFTIMFDFIKTEQGFLAYLTDIHVM